jgi:hypothetical protein
MGVTGFRLLLNVIAAIPLVKIDAIEYANK